MLRQLANHRIVMGICLPKSLKEAIDKRRGDIPRSTYIYRILERQFKENNVENRQNQSRPLPGQNPASSLDFPTTTCLGDDADG
jgi:hypothetical protein